MPRIIPLPAGSLENRNWSSEDRATVQVVLDGYDALIGGADESEVTALYAADYRDHATTVPGGDLGSLIAMVQQSTVNSPGTEIELHQVLVDGDRVVVYSSGRRASTDGWDGIMEIFRVDNGLIAEHWETIEPAGFFDAPAEGAHTDD
ncbi:nuclear transport factor 2 family protein [uncultured Microbacterium sp.]|uniref:nuclear transport factor 2 family protein n=1 Tax=uncultured Microbacterium sp. TaxID=191216 RepID=UPI0035CC901C